MGGQQSAPKPFPHDFQTAARLNAQAIYSAKPPVDIHQKSHMLADAYMIQKTKAIEKEMRHTSTYTGGAGGRLLQSAGQSAYGAEGPSEACFAKAHELYIKDALPTKFEDLPYEQPRMPADAFALTMGKKSEALRKATDDRNRFNLMTAPDTKATAKLDNVGHLTIESWMNADMIKAKLVTQGAIKKGWVGVKPTQDSEDLLFKEHLSYTAAMKPNRLRDGPEMGIKPNLPAGKLKDGSTAHAYAQGEQIKSRSAIEEANKLQMLPRPKYGADAYMVEHAEAVQRIIDYNLQAFDNDLLPPESPEKAPGPSPSKFETPTKLSLADEMMSA